MTKLEAAEVAHTGLGPVGISGLSVRLRPPAYADFARWREVRMRDRARLEPFWPTSQLSWAQRHDERVWVREVLDHRADARRGTAVAWVIEVDGRLAGQINLTDVDLRRGHGEIGIWVEADVARQGVAGLVVSMVLDDAFGRLGLARVVAPVASDNVATQRGAAAVGMRAEAVMSAYFDAGGRRQDHVLFAAVAEDVPTGGFTQAWLAHRGEPVGAAVPAPPPAPAAARRYPGSWRARAEVVRRQAPSVVRLPRQRVATATPAPRGTGLRAVPDAADGMTWQLEDHGRLLGAAGLRRVRTFLGVGEVWWRLGAAVEADGRGAEAIAPVVAHGLEVLGLSRLEALSAPGEPTEVLARLGFRREGTLRGYVDDGLQRGDMDLWALTAPLQR